MFVPALSRFAAAASVVSATAAVAEPAQFKIDPEHFAIVFSAEHIGYGSVWGLFVRGAGSFTYDEETRELSDLEVSVAADSVFTGHERRDGHVRSAEFVDAAAHPDITFVMTGAQETSETTGTITGDLTLRGVTKPVTLDVRLNKIGPYPFGPNYVIGVTAKTTLKRSDWGMTYAVDNGLVGDMVPFIFELEAIRQ
ncbi:YceI family protein [Acuticoccus kandeliae]|uniref:YceI family protein n=1 Tax=Acuticoccus kandeliae TaxID=2073160 RepID=UPI000D3EC764|nr:YceI family protein [Acuticoccus kandeliae]